jgi:UDP-glucose 4-epimerase
MNILVTGGAGYIGSITVKNLVQKGYNVVVLDNLVHGHKESISTPLVIADLLNLEEMKQKLAQYQFDAVVHFAAYALAGESMLEPKKYFENNILGGINLLEYMKFAGIPNIIFSSTCAIFGTPEKIPVNESATKNPESVYGDSKLMFEKVLQWYDLLYKIKHINLRYFNASGASLDGSLGEEHDPETHIIPIAMQVALGIRKEFTLFGTDYPTPDGTCIRDYIHVQDLADAHILALEKIQVTHESDSFNLGTGKGYSNREVLALIQKVSGKEFTIIEKERRLGDPPIIYADNKKAREVLGFQPKYSDLETIVKSAWKWHSKKHV